MEVRPYSYFRWCGYFWGPWVSFVMTDEFSVRVTKITSRIGVLWTHSLLSLPSLALRIFEAFVRILLIVNLSLNQTLLTLLLCETNLNDSIDFDNFSVRGYLPLIQKDSNTHMHNLVVYVKEGPPFARDLSLQILTLCFRLALLQLLSYFFFLYRSSCLCARLFILFHLPKVWFSPSTHLLMCSSLETLTSIIRTALSILVELIDLVNPIIIYLKQPYSDS